MSSELRRKSDPVARVLDAYSALPGVADELLDANGAVRPVWQQFIDHLQALDKEDIAARFARGDQHLRDAGVFYRQYGKADSTERDWPLVEQKAGKLEFAGGWFEGWMTVYAIDSGEMLCSTKLDFENRTKIKYYKSRYSSGQSEAQRAAEEELKKLFHDEATARMKKLSNGKLKLGYKVLE